LFDIGGALHGYQSDNTRVRLTLFSSAPYSNSRLSSKTFALKGSTIPEEHLKIWDSVHAAQRTALAVAKEGVLTRRVDEAARAILEQAGHGKYFTHRLGHGE
jgi:hypothetical protein